VAVSDADHEVLHPVPLHAFEGEGLDGDERLALVGAELEERDVALPQLLHGLCHVLLGGSRNRHVSNGVPGINLSQNGGHFVPFCDAKMSLAQLVVCG